MQICIGIRDIEGRTALHIAVAEGQDAAAAWLVDRGWDLLSYTKKGTDSSPVVEPISPQVPLDAAVIHCFRANPQV
jgi:ankyrin repeat protein